MSKNININPECTALIAHLNDLIIEYRALCDRLEQAREDGTQDTEALESLKNDFVQNNKEISAVLKKLNKINQSIPQ